MARLPLFTDFKDFTEFLPSRLSGWTADKAVLVTLLTFLSSSAWAAPLELVSPNPELSGLFGASVSGLTDVNGDGRGDVIVGAVFEDVDSTVNAGHAYIFSGSDGTLLLPLVSPNKKEWGGFGCSVSGVSDINGDGRDDVVVGALREDSVGMNNAGRAYVFSGSDGTLLWPLVSPNEEESGQFGFSVSGVPDVNGDGRDDVVVGANEEHPGVRPGLKGRTYIFSGVDGTLLRTLVLPGEESDAGVGGSVSGIPDVNGDGRGDVVSGAGYTMDAVSGAHIFSGSDGALLHTLVPPVVDPAVRFGWSVSGIPDTNGDGRGDVAVGTASPDIMSISPCLSFIFSGSDGTVLKTLYPPDHVIGSFGGTVAGIPDVNWDGRGDVIVGGRSLTALSACVFSGLDGSVLHTLSSPDQVNPTNFGTSLSGIPDVNGDNLYDFVVGAPGASESGRAYIFLGTGVPPTPTRTPTPTETSKPTFTPTPTLTPTPTNVKPSALLAFAPKAGAAPLEVELSGAGFDPDGEIVRCYWYFTNWQVADVSWRTSSALVADVTTYIYDAPGVYEIAFRVSDNEGGGNRAKGTVVVWTPLPTATAPATPTASPTPEPWCHCDVNGDGKVDHLDVIEMQHWWRQPAP